MSTPEEAITAAIERQRQVQDAQRKTAAEVAKQREEEEATQGPTVPAGEPELEQGGGER